jgi:cell division protein FtsN
VPQAVEPLVDVAPTPTMPPAAPPDAQPSAPAPRSAPPPLPPPAPTSGLSALTPALAAAAATPATPTTEAAPKAPLSTREVLRFAILYGPFASTADAERVERALIRAGHQTVRTRRDPGPTLYAVLIERVASEAEAHAIVTALRERGVAEATVASTDPLVVRVGDLRPLRGAVELAERVRQAGYRVRVAAQDSGRVAYVVRHGRFATRDEAEARSRELARLGVPAAQVVQVP